MPEFVDYIKKKNNTKVAVKYVKGSQKVEKTYNEVASEIEALAKEINCLNLVNKNIAVLGENSYEWILSYLAITVSKNTVVPIDKDLDINDVNLVINFDLPMSVEDYIHRVGRTARAFNSGVSLTFV